jgi:hypothetical protein
MCGKIRRIPNVTEFNVTEFKLLWNDKHICIMFFIFSELEHVLKKYGEPLTHRQSKELIALMDKNGDGQVDMDGKIITNNINVFNTWR